MMTLLALLVLGLVVTILGMSTYNYSKTISDNRTKTVTGAARLAVNQIDGDKIDYWLTEGKDAEYFITEVKLDDIIQTTPYLKYLYVYKFDDEGCHVVFDLIKPTTTEKGEDKDLTPDEFGDTIAIDKSLASRMSGITAGEDIEAYESHDELGYLLTKLTPVFDSSGNCVAYVGADVYMHEIDTYVQQVLGKTAIIAFIIFAIYVLLSLYTTSLFRRADEKQSNIEEEQK